MRASRTSYCVLHGRPGSPRRCFPLYALLFVLVALPAASAGRFSVAAAPAPAPASVPLRPYVYTTASSTTSYDIIYADGVSKERRVARIKVDSVFFGDVSARLSTDGSATAFRVSGDRLGGSSLYSVDTRTGKYVVVAQSKNTGDGLGAYVWSPAGNTLAFVRNTPALDPEDVDSAYGTIYVFSVGFKAIPLSGSHGRDRVVSFSGDGLGVIVSRLESSSAGALQNLVYLPLSGGEGRVLLRSRPGLRLSSFAVYAPPGVPSRVAALAEGDFSQIGTGSGSTAGPGGPLSGASSNSKVPTGGRLSRPNGLGVIVADLLGTWPSLVRRDAEAFPYVSWAADGSGIVMGGTRSGNSWVVDMAGQRRQFGMSLRDLSLVTWSADNTLAVAADSPSTRIVSVTYASGKVAATRYVGASPRAAAAAVRLAVPYIHQVRDTAGNGDGNWACGPTALAMSLAYFGKIEPWPVFVANSARVQAAGAGLAGPPLATATPVTLPAPPSTPQPVTGGDYAPYITNSYTAYGHTYSSRAPDPRGSLLAGLYGTICPTGLASWQQMENVLSWHNLASQYVSATWDGIVSALKRGHPVLLGNELTSEGHIILVIGYTPDGNLVVNDPYGNRFAPGYGGNDGKELLYPWKLVTPRRALEVIGTLPTPTPVPTKTATATRTLAPSATATLTHVPAATFTATPTSIATLTLGIVPTP